MNGTSALILIEFIRCDIHAEVEIEIGQQVVQLRERLLAEVAELQQVVAVELHEVPHRIHVGGFQTVQGTDAQVLIRELGLQQLTHVEDIPHRTLRRRWCLPC